MLIRAKEVQVYVENDRLIGVDRGAWSDARVIKQSRGLRLLKNRARPRAKREMVVKPEGDDKMSPAKSTRRMRGTHINNAVEDTLVHSRQDEVGNVQRAIGKSLHSGKVPAIRKSNPDSRKHHVTMGINMQKGVTTLGDPTPLHGNMPQQKRLMMLFKQD